MARAHETSRACCGRVGVGAGLEEALGVLEIAQLHLRDKWSLVRDHIPALKRCSAGARDESPLDTVLERKRRRRATHPPQPVLQDRAPNAVGADTPPGYAVF